RRDVVVVLPDLALEGVGEVERLVVGAPAGAVRADDAVVDERHRQVRVEAPQPADLQLLLVVHAAGEEATFAVALAVVEADARLPRAHQLDLLRLAAELVGIEAVVEGEHRAAALAQRHRADVVLERPALGLARLRVVAPDRGLVDAAAGAVNPVEPAFLHVPDRALAEVIVAGEEAFDLHQAARSERPERSSSPAATSALRMRSIS